MAICSGNTGPLIKYILKQQGKDIDIVDKKKKIINKEKVDFNIREKRPLTSKKGKKMVYSKEKEITTTDSQLILTEQEIIQMTKEFKPDTYDEDDPDVLILKNNNLNLSNQGTGTFIDNENIELNKLLTNEESVYKVLIN